MLVLFLLGKLFFSQNVDRIEFESFNAVIIGSRINIDFVPMKNNKRDEVKVYFKNKNNFFTKKISEKKYVKIYKAILNISNESYTKDNDSIKNFKCLDGASTHITTFRNNFKKKYSLDCISSEDRNDEKRKYFWKATKLILKTVGKPPCWRERPARVRNSKIV